MPDKSLSVHLIVRNGEKYLRYCLNSLRAQTYPDFEVIVFDNASSDATKEIVKKEYPNFRLYESDKNYFAWPGFSRSLTLTNSQYAMLLSVDVILEKNFLKELIAIMASDHSIGAAQGKSLQWHFDNMGEMVKTKLIDSAGFEIHRSRKIVNRGQGEEDKGQYDKTEEIFGAEGACLILRRKALEDARICINKFKFQDKTFCEISDEDMQWYGEDLDLVWRMRLLGWKQYYVPRALMWHDRSTTKGYARHWTDYFRRIEERKKISINKRRLNWRNTHWAFIKNELPGLFLRDLFHILKREFLSFGYMLLLEPRVLLEIPRFFKQIPKMTRKRKEIMKKSRVRQDDIQKWFK